MTEPTGIQTYEFTHNPSGFSIEFNYVAGTVRQADAGDVTIQNGIRTRMYNLVGHTCNLAGRRAIYTVYDQFLWKDITHSPPKPPTPGTDTLFDILA